MLYCHNCELPILELEHVVIKDLYKQTVDFCATCESELEIAWLSSTDLYSSTGSDRLVPDQPDKEVVNYGKPKSRI